MGEIFENKLLELARRGDTEKANYLKSLDNTVLPSFVKRIQENDKTVLKEMVVPKWVSWDLLYDWALSKKNASGRRCILCGELNEVGIGFNNKFICEHCFLKLKNMG